jgi:hypothetical protein
MAIHWNYRDRRVELLDRNQDVGGAAGDGRSGSSFRRNQLGRSLSQSDVPVTEKNGTDSKPMKMKRFPISLT